MNGIIMPITDNISSVDGVVSDTGGNVNLSAVRYVSQTLEDAQKVQARKNIGVDGQVYPCTAAALEDMSQEQQAELYTQGYRAIKTDNNGTVVLLGLSADGSLEWLGCNQPRGNLLDNPDFAIAQAGYGGLHGAQKYATDRWILDSGEISHDGTNMIIDGVIAQRIAESADLEGKEITYVVYPQSGEPAVLTTKLEKGMSTITSSTSLLTIAIYQEGDLFVANMNAQGAQCAIKGTGLFIGSYTPKTLPPLETTKYMHELLECLRYYTQENIYFTFSGSTNLFDFFVPFKIQMRIAPTSAVFSMSNGAAGYVDYFDGSQWAQATAQIETYQNGVRVFGSTGSAHQVVRFKMASSADL